MAKPVPLGDVLQDFRKPKTRQKYGNRVTVVDGERFDSRKEYDRYAALRLLEMAGEINGLQRQKPYELIVNGVKVCRYVPDFVYYEMGALIVEDVKSPATRKNAAYRLKKKLMQAIHGITIREVL